ncbi:MAG: redoxin domain-containing protein [Verrucomicrobiae bacterium]|nr:redoxin domain-containing protein [Verrucomicrobiae bacterium]
MKNPTPPFLVASLLTLAASPVFGENASTIYLDFEAKKAAALETYLEKNPEADDRMAAESMLIDTYQSLDDSAKAAPLLRNKYNAMSKGEDAELQELIGGVVQPLFQIYLQSGDKEKAKGFLDTVQNDFKEHSQASGIMQVLSQFASRLDMPTVGDTMEIAYTSIDGHPVDITKMQEEGKVVLVEFWATWCPPCVAELPNLMSGYEKYHEKGFEIVAISLDSDDGTVKAFTEQRGLPWPQYVNGMGDAGDIATKYGVTGIPATFLIGKDGKIVATDLRGGDLEKNLSKLIGES